MLDIDYSKIKNDDQLVNMVLAESQLEYNKLCMLKEDFDRDSKKINIFKRTLNSIHEKFFNKELKMILETKGDIKSFPNYKDLKESIKTLKERVNDKSLRPMIIEVDKCLSNLEKYSRNFKLFFDKNDFVVSIYTSTVAALIASTGSLILDGLEYNFSNNTVNIVPRKNAKLTNEINNNAVLNFNKMCSDGTLLKLFSQVKNEINTGGTTNNFFGSNPLQAKTGNQALNSISKGIKDVVDLPKDVASNVVQSFKNASFGRKIAVVIAVSLATLFIIREVVYYFYYFRNAMSNYLDTLSSFVEMNATRSKTSSPKIREKQLAIASKLSDLSDKISSYNKSVTKQVKKDIKSEESVAVKRDNDLDVASNPTDILL